MSHFAKVENGRVTQVLVIEQDVINTGHFGDPSSWIQTSYNTREGVHYDPETGKPSLDQSKALRKNFAGIGYTYDASRDAFIPEKPWESWILNEQKCCWEPPVPLPDDTGTWVWDEPSVSWVKNDVSKGGV